MATLNDTTINDTGFLTLPVGSQGQRPSASQGMVRYNSDHSNASLEFYDGSQWRPVTGFSEGTVGTGGNSIVYGNNGISHMFTSTGSHTFTPTFTGNVRVLVVGGGGGSGYDWAGGGGGGGVIYERAYPVTAGSGISINVGSGTGSHYGPGWSQGSTPGNPSSFAGLTAVGGGGSGCWGHPPSGRSEPSWTGRPGGSGGGGGNTGDGTDSRRRVRAGDGTTGQGYPGGSGVRFNTSGDNCHWGGGGGGAGGRGRDCADERQNAMDDPMGGPGSATDILGPTLYFGGGGAGGAHHGHGYCTGGVGGGGGGGIYHGSPFRPGTERNGLGGGQALNHGQPAGAHRNRSDGGNGGANTGGGAGGGQWGQRGGDGIVIVRY